MRLTVLKNAEGSADATIVCSASCSAVHAAFCCHCFQRLSPPSPPPTHTHACQERKAEAEREVERARGAVESGEGGVFVSSVRVTLTWVTCVRVWEPLRAPGSHADQKEVAV